MSIQYDNVCHICGEEDGPDPYDWCEPCNKPTCPDCGVWVETEPSCNAYGSSGLVAAQPAAEAWTCKECDKFNQPEEL